MNSFFALKKGATATATALRGAAGRGPIPESDEDAASQTELTRHGSPRLSVVAPTTRGHRDEEEQGSRAPYVAPSNSLIAANDLVKSYRKGRHLVPVLLGVDLQVADREFLAIEGQSGSGKSTLLHLLGTLDAPDGGEIHFDGRRVDNLPLRERDRMRNHSFGMIFQFYHLLPELTALENVLMPIMIASGTLHYWRHKRQHVERARELLEMVGLSHRLGHRPQELSGGEMQRAAIARALIARPRLLLADEPTGNLDRKNGEEILKILRTLNQRENVTIVMVTHDHSLAQQADRIVQLAEGRVQNAA